MFEKSWTHLGALNAYISKSIQAMLKISTHLKSTLNFALE